jgi:hypothetical protein
MSDERFDHVECDAGSMIDRPGPLRDLDGYFAAARIAHEYVADLHRELVELDADDDHTRELLRGSAAVAAERMPVLSSRLRDLGANGTSKSCRIRWRPSAPSSS